MSNEQPLLSKVTQALQLLAADYETQIAALPDFVHVPDELALVYDECVPFIHQLIETGLLTTDQAEKLQELQKVLDSMSNQASLWTPSALERSSEWQQVRARACAFLRLIEVPQQPPDLSWIRYVRGDTMAYD